MRTRNCLLGIAGLLLAATPAAADLPFGGGGNLDLNELAAAVVLPIVTGGQPAQSPLGISGDVVMDTAGEAATLATISNGLSLPVLLKIDMVDGAPGGSWNSTSFECELTGRETTTFVFQNGAVYVECSDGNDTDGDPRVLFTGVANGFMFVSVADPRNGRVMSIDALLADAIVIDTVEGKAYSFGAISFQAGVGQNDGNKVYRFDGQEYSRFPAALASNFLTPTDTVNAELILFTLDGSTGTTAPPRAKLGGFAYNDDEEAVDFQYEFDCFDIVALDAVNPNIFNGPGGVGLGTLSGHLELVAQPTATANDAHDDQFGDGNDTRIRPVHGWLVQDVTPPRTVVPPVDGAVRAVLLRVGQPYTGLNGALTYGLDMLPSAAWGRPLGQSRTPVVPFQLDQDAVFHADTTL